MTSTYIQRLQSVVEDLEHTSRLMQNMDDPALELLPPLIEHAQTVLREILTDALRDSQIEL